MDGLESSSELASYRTGGDLANVEALVRNHFGWESEGNGSSFTSDGKSTATPTTRSANLSASANVTKLVAARRAISWSPQ
jgi:hypothetical protein